ncbi:MAG: DNA polymerase III subunit delta [Bdellovibrio sp.]|nr:MAG: DNA polymerase III subunit delta [Bdellovibrio sp.]
MATIDLRRLQQSLEHRSPESLYLLVTEDAFLFQEALSCIKKAALDESLKDFNYDQFFAPEDDPQDVVDAVQMLPTMSERRLVIYRDVHHLKEAHWEKLLPLLKKPLSSCCFVLTMNKADKRKKFYKTISQSGTIVELQTPYDNHIPAWIQYIASKHQVRLTPKAIQYLHHLVGSHLSELNNEIQKLQQFVSDPTKPINEETVLHVVSASRSHNIFEFTDALAQKDKVKALTYLASLLEDGQSPISVISMVTRHIRILEKLKEGMNQGLKQTQLCQASGIPPYFLKKYQQQSHKWNPQQLSQAIQALQKTDMALKTSPLSSHIWLENLVLQICP